MKNFFKILLAAILISTISSCSKSSSDNFYWEVKKVQNNTKGDAKDVEFLTGWVDKYLKEIEPLTTGQGENLSNAQIEALKLLAESALNNFVKDFEEAKKKTDFATAEIDAALTFNITSDNFKYTSDKFVIKRENTDAGARMHTARSIDTNLTGLFAVSEQYNLNREYDGRDFECDEGTVLTVNPELSKLYNRETRVEYSGKEFFAVSSAPNGFSVTMAYYKEFLSDYLGDWYLLIPGRMIKGSDSSDAIFVIGVFNK